MGFDGLFAGLDTVSNGVHAADEGRFDVGTKLVDTNGQWGSETQHQYTLLFCHATTNVAKC